MVQRKPDKSGFGKIFSLPAPYYMSDEYFYEDFLPFVRKYKRYIYDIYFTCHIPPFKTDAMGLAGDNRRMQSAHLQMMLELQRETGVAVSPTFNNILIPATERNLDIFLKKFKPLYRSGVRVITLPSYVWLKTGKVKKEYPDLLVKNTVLRQLREPIELWNYGVAGFDYVNLDRFLVRSCDTLGELNEVKKRFNKEYGRTLRISILANDDCVGFCPAMSEHYTINQWKRAQYPWAKDVDIFYPCTITNCSVANPLKIANIPPVRAEWKKYVKLVDVFKLHGRESIKYFEMNKEFIKGLVDGTKSLLQQRWRPSTAAVEAIPKRERSRWLEAIRNCHFNCWKCNVCDRIWNKLEQDTIERACRGSNNARVTRSGVR